MKAAGELLSRSAAYRSAIAATKAALAHLPRFAIYNGLNSWGKQFEVAHPPKQSFHTCASFAVAACRGSRRARRLEL